MLKNSVANVKIFEHSDVFNNPHQDTLTPRKNMRLPRSLSVIETWGFGITTPIGWLNVAVPMHAALGLQSIFVWLFATIVTIMLNLQIKQLGMHWQEMSGGTANYLTRLLKNYRGLGSYAAIGYILGWISVPVVNAIVITDLIKANLEIVGVGCPEMLLKIGLTIIPFIVAFSGIRALGILQVFLAIPALLFGLAFCFQGISWLILSPDSPGFFPHNFPDYNFSNWTKWYFFGVYIFYGCETSAAFVADSKQPTATLRCLSFINWIIPLLFLGSPWVLMRLADLPGNNDNAFLNLVTASNFFWGEYASFLVTLLIVSGCLLNSAASAALIPRILYQLSLDGYISPVFTFVSRRGVLQPAIIATFLGSIFCLFLGSLDHLAVITGTGWFMFFIILHLALWLRRANPEVLWPWVSLGLCVLEIVIFIIGGLTWGKQDLILGLVFPLLILLGDFVLRRLRLPIFHKRWWLNREQAELFRNKNQDFVLLQVGTMIASVCGAIIISWQIHSQLDANYNSAKTNLLAVLLLTFAFVEVAIACWTTLPQVAKIDEARKQAENLFINALDAILVLDEKGRIVRVNPAAQVLFKMNTQDLFQCYLNKFLPELAGTPNQWTYLSEQILLIENAQKEIVLEASISNYYYQYRQEYMIILRDITERKQAERELHQALQIKEELVKTATLQAQELEKTFQNLQQTQAQLIQTEKMSSLGQLVAGVAHEINNPVNFIYGNITHISNYIKDILDLINLYQQRYGESDSEIRSFIEEIDLKFLIADLPKMLSSMKLGADRIRQIVLTLRNFSRLDEAEMKPVNIHEGIDSTLLILQSQIKAKSDKPAIQVIKQYGNLPEIECYAGQLNQVFMNIISNAIDALHQHNTHLSWQELEQNPRTITISTQLSDSDWVSICIKDNGAGIDETVKNKLFDPFFTTKPIGEGTGLGLSISYQIIVDKHRGRIYCQSELGKGAEFWIEIPVKQVN